MRNHHGNPSGAHLLAREANRLVNESREVLGEFLGVDPGDVVFTSGGTESDNLAIGGVAGKVVCSATEHPAVLASVEARGGEVARVAASGRVDLARLAELIEPETSLVSVMLANNETGITNDLDQIAEVVRSANHRTLVHTDAVQAAPWLDLTEAAKPADLISVSGHKLGGPKGVGALGLRSGISLDPQNRGGSQERDRRGGTHNVAGIVGMAAAVTELTVERVAAAERVTAMRDRLLDGLLDLVPNSHETGPRELKTPNIAHICFDGVESEALLFLLERAGIMATAASSCASGAQEPSHVLAAMGVPRDRALGSLRISLGYSSTDADIDAALGAIPPVIERLRSGGKI